MIEILNIERLKIIEILNGFGYRILIGKEYIKLSDYNTGDIVIIYDRENITVQTLKKVYVYIMKKFTELIVEIIKDEVK